MPWRMIYDLGQTGSPTYMALPWWDQMTCKCSWHQIGFKWTNPEVDVYRPTCNELHGTRPRTLGH